MFSEQVRRIVLGSTLITCVYASVAHADVTYQPYYYDRDAVMFARPFASTSQSPSAAVVVRPSQSDSPAFSSVSIRTTPAMPSINASAATEPVNARPQYYAPPGHPQPVQNTSYTPPASEMDGETLDLGSGFGW
jgi:hypothetical protein